MNAWKFVMVALLVAVALTAGPHGTPPSQVQWMVAQLDLTADQKAKIDPILVEGAKLVRALRGDSSPEAASKKVEIREATDGKIRPILTDEQWKKLEQLRDDRANQDQKIEIDFNVATCGPVFGATRWTGSEPETAGQEGD